MNQVGCEAEVLAEETVRRQEQRSVMMETQLTEMAVNLTEAKLSLAGYVTEGQPALLILDRNAPLGIIRITLQTLLNVSRFEVMVSE